MSWRVAESLKKLREQIGAAYPNRDKSSDGSIGDAAHASRNSDHNPWVKDGRGQGVVTAIDIDEDLSAATHTLVPILESIIASRDPRVKYIIYEGRMLSSYPASGYKAWTWRPYSGKNPHRHHAHISVNPSPYHYDNRADWNIGTTPIAKLVERTEIDRLKQDLAEPGLLDVPPSGMNAATETATQNQATDPAVPAPQPVQQQAENITNVQTGGSQVPADFVAEDKTVDAPPKEGSTESAAKVTIAGFVVPTFLVGIVTAIKSAVADGYVSGAQIGEVVINFISANQKYVFAGLGLMVSGMMLKKLYKQITLWLQMYFASRPDRHNVTVKPQ